MSHARSPSYSRYSLVQAELIAMNIAAQETVWLRNLMCEINAALTGLETRLHQADCRYPREGLHDHFVYPTMISATTWSVSLLLPIPTLLAEASM